MSDNVIKIRGTFEEFGGLVASEALTPGELVEFGGSDDLQPHSVADANAEKMFVRNRTELGEEIGDDVPAGDSLTVIVPLRGAVVYAWLDAGENVAQGDALSSAGNGNLKAEAVTVDPTSTTAEAVEADAIVGYADEAVDNSGSTTRTRIRVRIA